MAFIDDRQTRKERGFITRHRNEPVHRIGSGPNAHAERFVRSIKEECLNRVIPLRERHFRRTVHEFVEHYHHAIIRVWTTSSSTATRLPWTQAGFADASESAACSSAITARRNGLPSSARPRPLARTLRVSQPVGHGDRDRDRRLFHDGTRCAHDVPATLRA